MILFNVESKSRIAESFVTLCMIFVIQNAMEFLGYAVYVKAPELGSFFVHIYVISLYFMFPAVLVLALALAHVAQVDRIAMVLFGISAGLAALHVSGFVVAGLTFVGWSVITVPGTLYWVAMGYILSCGVATFTFLLRQVKVNPNPEVRYNCKVAVFAFMPLAAVAVGVLGLRLLGFASSSSISLPIATLLFLYILLVHSNGNLFWLSTKFKTIVAVMTMDKNSSMEEILARIEKLRIEEALKVTGGEQKSAARLISVPPSTLNKKISKHKISVTQFNA